MPTIEEAIEQAKEAKATAAQAKAIDEAQASGVNFTEEKKERSAFENAVGSVTDAMHNSMKAELVELHSFIPEKLLSSVYEIAVIAQAGYREQRVMSGFTVKTDESGHETWYKRKGGKNILDPIIWLQNEMIVQELIENARILMRQLAALNGYRSEQGVKNVASAVSGESARLAALNPGLFPAPTQAQGLVAKLKKAFHV